MDQNPDRKLKLMLRPKDVAELLGVEESTLKTWRSSGRVALPFLRLGHRTVRYRLEDVQRFIEERSRQQSGAAPAQP